MTFLGITLCLHGVPTEGKMVDQPYQGVVHGLPQVNHEVVHLVGNKRYSGLSSAPRMKTALICGYAPNVPGFLTHATSVVPQTSVIRSADKTRYDNTLLDL